MNPVSGSSAKGLSREPDDDGSSLLKALLPKTAGAVIAGGVVVFNAWFAGAFSGHHPIDEDNWRFFVLVFLQATFVSTAVTLIPALMLDVAAAVLGDVSIVLLGDAVGVFRDSFDLGQFLGQLFIAYSAVAGVAGYRKLMLASRRAHELPVRPPAGKR